MTGRILQALLLAALVLVLLYSCKQAQAQGSPVLISAEVSHPRGAVEGQTVKFSWRVTDASVPITRCVFATKTPDAETWDEVDAGSIWSNTHEIMQPAHDLSMSIACHWRDGEQEPAYQMILTVPLKAAEELKKPPQCYPSPIGDGTFPDFSIEEQSLCLAYWCDVETAEPRPVGMCLQINEAWSVERLVGLTTSQADEAWRDHDWQALSEHERQRLLQMLEQSRPAPVLPEARYVVAGASGDEKNQSAVFAGKEDGTRGYQRLGFVDNGIACDCNRSVSFSWGEWCWIEDGTLQGYANCRAIDADGSP